ncbi:MAG: META domain-containing protein [Rubripirellula sp.]
MNRVAPRLCLLTFALSLGWVCVSVSAQEVVLSSWNDRDAKASLVNFVESVTDPASDQFVAKADRIAVFDNDGTLWPENPLPFQLFFALDELKRLAPEHPEWKDDKFLAAALNDDMDVIKADVKAGLLAILSATHAGMTTTDFDKRVADWIKQAKHARFDRRYADLAYQPMLEVLDYLRANGFKTYIVSGGGVNFMRVWSEDVYGIPPEQIIGSRVGLAFQVKDGVSEIVKKAELEFVDDKEWKPIGIYQQIGKRPILAFGNSDGDKQMLEWTTLGHAPSLGLLVHHTDGEREYEYDRHPKSSGKLDVALDQAAERKWVLVDMAKDWKSVFSNSKKNNAVTLDAIIGPTWTLASINGKKVSEQSTASMILGDGGKVAGNTGVNRFSGKAEIKGNKISFGPLATTRRAGAPALMAQESMFLKAMSNVVAMKLGANGTLDLVNANDVIILTFAPNRGDSKT